jgi:hypothetical protein
MAKNGKAEPKATNTKKSTPKVKILQLKVERINPDNIRSAPVNDIIITHSQNEFFITFSSVEPPLVLDPKELSQLTAINAIARSKIVVSQEFLEAIIKALNINLENYKKTAR